MPFDVPSRLDLFAIGRDYVRQRNPKIDPAQVDIAGSDANIFVGLASYVAYQVVLALVQDVNALLLDGAFGEDLDRYGFDRYGLTRKGAASALGAVRFFRATFAGGAGTIPLGTRLSTLNGVEYVTTEPASFGGTDLEKFVAVRAAQAGTVTQVGANTIRLFADATAIFDPSMQVTNPEATAGGADVEDDGAFRERIRQFWNTARRGTLAAIVFGALTVDGVASATAIEVLGPDATPARVVELFIADAAGVSSQVLGAAVRTALGEYRAAGIAVITNTSVPLIVDVKLHLTFSANVDTTTLTSTVRAAIVDFINNYGVGQTLTRASLESVLQRFVSSGLIVNQSTIVEPTGDLVPDVGTTFRTRFENVVVV